MITNVLYALGFILILLGVLALVGLLPITGTSPVALLVIGVVLVIVAYFLSRPRSSV